MQMNNAYERKHNYPIVVFHGFAGFGEDELMNKFIPYFGWYNNINIKKYAAKYDKEFYVPSISGFSSMWDRCCEMYAQIVGGTVDYGKAHSEKYGHKRYGRTYKGCVRTGANSTPTASSKRSTSWATATAVPPSAASCT